MVIKQDCDITKTQFPWTELVLTTFHLNHSVINSSKTSETLETWKVCLTTGYTDYYKIVSFLLPCKILIAIERNDFFVLFLHTFQTEMIQIPPWGNVWPYLLFFYSKISSNLLCLVLSSCLERSKSFSWNIYTTIQKCQSNLFQQNYRCNGIHIKKLNVLRKCCWLFLKL